MTVSTKLGQDHLFFYNVGYYSLLFVFLYYMAIKCLNKFKYTYRPISIKLICFILFELLCVYQFALYKNKLNGSIEKIKTMVTSTSEVTSQPPSFSEGNGAPISRRAALVEKLSYVMTMVRERQSSRFIKNKERDDILSAQLQSSLMPVNLSKRDGIANANNTIEQYEELISSKRQLIDDLYSQMNVEISKLNISSHDLREFEIGEKEGKEQYNRIFDLQENELSACKELLIFIENNADKIQLDHDQFIFASNDALIKYNNLVAQLTKLSEMESALITNNTDGLNGFVKTLNDSKI